jgi:hypothetical protein
MNKILFLILCVIFLSCKKDNKTIHLTRFNSIGYGQGTSDTYWLLVVNSNRAMPAGTIINYKLDVDYDSGVPGFVYEDTLNIGPLPVTIATELTTVSDSGTTANFKILSAKEPSGEYTFTY